MSVYDRWLSNDEGIVLPVEEYDPIHAPCGKPCSDHIPVQVTDEANGIDYETMACPS